MTSPVEPLPSSRRPALVSTSARAQGTRSRGPRLSAHKLVRRKPPAQLPPPHKCSKARLAGHDEKETSKEGGQRRPPSEARPLSAPLCRVSLLPPPIGSHDARIFPSLFKDRRETHPHCMRLPPPHNPCAKLVPRLGIAILNCGIRLRHKSRCDLAQLTAMIVPSTFSALYCTPVLFPLKHLP